ncbi:hypothetical protein BH24DEI2_BH24DEI2_00850 [soil metagenome]
MRISLVTVLTALALLSTFGFAQDAAAAPKIVFVDTQAAINAHPAGQAATELQATAKTEVEALQSDLQTLLDKANSGQQLTADEQSRFQQLREALTSVQQRYAEQINTAVQPALEAVNKIIAEIAAENGYDMVLDSVVAGQQGTGLVVFAQETLNITPQVLERVNALP